MSSQDCFLPFFLAYLILSVYHDIFGEVLKMSGKNYFSKDEKGFLRSSVFVENGYRN